MAMVLWSGLKLLAAGLGLGLVGSYWAGKLIAQHVWRVRAFDVVSFGTVALVLLLAGLQACFWPARRAARVDPVTALRYE
jgi:putative ABC transport system permease protein